MVSKARHEDEAIFDTTRQYGGWSLYLICGGFNSLSLYVHLTAGTILQSSSATILANGTTTETFSFSDDGGNTYTRTVAATNSSVTHDVQGGSLAASSAGWIGSNWPWPLGGSHTIPKGGSGVHDNFAGRLLQQREKGKITIW